MVFRLENGWTARAAYSISRHGGRANAVAALQPVSPQTNGDAGIHVHSRSLGRRHCIRVGESHHLVYHGLLIAGSTVALLEDLGHEVVEVHSAREALQLLKGGLDADLLITDTSNGSSAWRTMSR
jgi:hypothetical protein